jgi:hypothetical protein
MTAVLRRRVLAALLAVVAVALSLAAGSSAAIVTESDNQGRSIRFDVRATNVDVDWYADVLRASLHGNEISAVTVRIVPEAQIPKLCGGEQAAACYQRDALGGPLIIIAAGKSTMLEQTLLHEYGHHLDGYWHVPGVPELNGTEVWWNLRGMATLLATHQVAFDYSLDWYHSIPEIFAEDYAAIQLTNGNAHFAMQRWLAPPSEELKQALIAELGPSTSSFPAAPNLPLLINRKGTLAPRGNFATPFGLLATGRHITVTVTVSKPKRKGIRARAQVVCNDNVVATGNFGKGRTKRVLDLPNMGPADCEARVVSTSSVKLAYTLRLRVAIEAA